MIKYFLISGALSLALGLGALVVMIIFIEGWGVAGTMIATVLSFFLAGFAMGKWRPKSNYYSWLFIFLPLAFTMINKEQIKLFFELIVSPSSINFMNFYVFVPLVALITSVLGVFLGTKKTKS